MPLALFDLDHTLIDIDSDFAWTTFMTDKKLIDPQEHLVARQKFMDDYNKGQLDVEAFYSYTGEVFSRFSIEQLITLREEFTKDYIAPHMLSKGKAVIAEHKAKGHTTLLISATNSFLVERMAKEFKFDYFIGTDIAIENNRFVGKLKGTPSLKEGKVIRMQEWLTNHPSHTPNDLKKSWFYSDSLNDIPLLSEVAHPIAINPDPTLEKHAKKLGWEIQDFRN